MEYLGNDHYRLSSGRTLYANGGIIGLSPDHEEPCNFPEGYDGGLRHVDDFEEITSAEATEVAEFMIRLWTERLAVIRSAPVL